MARSPATAAVRVGEHEGGLPPWSARRARRRASAAPGVAGGCRQPGEDAPQEAGRALARSTYRAEPERLSATRLGISAPPRVISTAAPAGRSSVIGFTGPLESTQVSLLRRHAASTPPGSRASGGAGEPTRMTW